MMLKLEVGKLYLDRNGVVQGPLLPREAREAPDFKFASNGRSWRIDGSHWINGASQSDLVSEYVLPQVPGIPERYRLVRIGVPKIGQWYVGENGMPVRLMDVAMTCNFAVIEPIAPPVP